MCELASNSHLLKCYRVLTNLPKKQFICLDTQLTNNKCHTVETQAGCASWLSMHLTER